MRNQCPFSRPYSFYAHLSVALAMALRRGNNPRDTHRLESFITSRTFISPLSNEALDIGLD